jgi:VWFA-related protein
MTRTVSFRSICLAVSFALTVGTIAPSLAQSSGASAKARSTAAPSAAASSTAPDTASQAPASTAPTISVDARLVNIPVVVHDKKGALVQNLTKDNFVLQVDGHPQTIRYFNLDTDLPLTLGLLVDTSQSQRDVIDDERTASTAFLNDMLTGPADRDKAFIVQFAHQTDLLQDVTSSKPKLQAALKQLDSPSFASSGSNSGGNGSDQDSGNNGGSGRGRRGGGTTLYDALFLSSDELMARQKGRKAVIILSDGDDNGSKETLASSIEAAQRADTIVYAIYFKGREPGQDRDQDQSRRGGGFPGGRGGGYPGGGGGYPGGGGGRGGNQGSNFPTRPDGKKILQRMADETGGRLFEVTKKQTVADIYTQIGQELRAQYRLGYTPDEKTASDGYHRIDLTLTKSSPKDLYIQTRDGYYTGQ